MENELPGLDFETIPSGAMVNAVKVTIESKRSQGLLAAEHEALAQLAISLAITIDAGASTGKTSVPAAAQQLLNVLERLPMPLEENLDDALTAAMRAPGDTDQ